jgi:type I restriction enzyme S subunit
MASNWRNCSFDDLIRENVLSISDGYRAKNDELGGSGPIFLRAGHVTDTHIDLAGVERFHAELASRVESKASRPGDVVITTKGNSTGRVAFVGPNLPCFIYSPHLSYWRSLDHERLHPLFLRYWSRSREFWTQLQGLKASTDMAPYLSLVDQRRLRITLPSPSVQRAVGEILNSLDDKIDLNRRMNQTLEAMAQALFQSWFVDFDPVRAKAEGRQPEGVDAGTAALFPNRLVSSELGEIPEGWRVSCLGEIGEVIDCLHSKKPDRKGNGRPLLQLNNIRDDGLLDLTDSYLVSDEDYAKWTARMEAQEGDCVITNVGRVGAASQVPAGVNAALGRNMTGIRLKPGHNWRSFLITALTSQFMRQEIANKTDTGTILDALNVRSIPRLRFVLPSQAVLRSFEEIALPLRNRMESNLREARTLAQVRDTLLPKLLSGEVCVRDAEAHLAASA